MRVAAIPLLLALAVPAQARAWGFEAHRFITGRAIALLPAELKPFFEQRRAFIVERSIDPDLWRSAGFDQEPPNHFLDLDYEGYGAYPFEALPRDYDAAVQKFGREVVRTQGLLPWRTQEMFGNLARTFAALNSKTPPSYALDDIAFFSALLSHYVADGHVPLHAVVNYDGQLTNQRGVHSRWESELFVRYQGRMTFAPQPMSPVRNPRDFMFEVLLASNRAVPELLAADKRAADGRELYDDGYFEAFAQASLPLVEKRMNAAMSAVAAVITGAWEEAGRPSLNLPPRAPRRIAPPR